MRSGALVGCIGPAAAFVRDQSPSPSSDNPAYNAEHHHRGPGGNDFPKLATDIQAALTVIGRRPLRSERTYVDLSLADLCGANLTNLNFDNVWLWRTKLRSAVAINTRLHGANLCWAQLQSANLSCAVMEHAELWGAQLKDAFLVKADLHGADLRRARLQGADLRGANLQDAILGRAELQGADLRDHTPGARTPGTSLPPNPPGASFPVRGLTPTQLADAKIDKSTRLPKQFRIKKSARK